MAGFLSEQAEEKEERKRELEQDTIEGEKAGEEELPQERTEEELSTEKCEKNFYSLIKDMLKRFDSISFEHIEKAFGNSIKEVKDDYLKSIDNMEK